MNSYPLAINTTAIITLAIVYPRYCLQLVYAAVNEYAKDHNHDDVELTETNIQLFAKRFYATKSMGNKGFLAKSLHTLSTPIYPNDIKSKPLPLLVVVVSPLNLI